MTRHCPDQFGLLKLRCILDTCKRGSVGQSEGLLIPRSSVRFRLKPENSNPHGFELHRPSIKGTKLLLKVIKTITIIAENLPMPRCSSSCVLCTSGKYSSETGEIAESTCTDCPAASYSGDGSKLLTNCTCKRCYTGKDGAEFSWCITGTWKAVNGSSSCILCASEMYSSEPAEISKATCDDCPAHSYYSDGSNMIPNCTCISGSTGPDDENCTQCESGQYAIVLNGASTCLTCPWGYWSIVPGSSACTVILYLSNYT